jgi:hypothetical protein
LDGAKVSAKGRRWVFCLELVSVAAALGTVAHLVTDLVATKGSWKVADLAVHSVDLLVELTE